MINNRQKSILQLIVREFIESGEAVASVTLTEKYDIGCCSATVRNDMARLEEMGYLEQPHASSGRIPKDKAYRLFVNEIMGRKIESPPESTVHAIEKEYQLIQLHMELLLEKTARLLSEITQYTSMLLAPRIRRNFFKYLKLISLKPSTILLFMLTNTGSIIHRIVEVSRPMRPEDLERITNLLNERLQGSSVDKIEPLLSEISARDINSELVDCIRSVSQNFQGDHPKEVFLGGRKHLLDVLDFKDVSRIKLLMELLEDEKVVAEILSCTLREGGIHVLIGEENPIDGMRECSMVTAKYTIDGEPVGTLGIIGPRRMPYEKVIPIVSFTAENMSNKLSRLEQL